MKTFYLLTCFLALSCILYSQVPEEEIIGTTVYDLQTYRSIQQRMYLHDDGTLGATWNMAFQYPQFPDLGVGYNYFDGTNWGVYPYEPITSGPSENPSYTRWGYNGEMIAAQGVSGLYLCSRINKGTGPWNEHYIPVDGLMHPSIVATGNPPETLHLLYMIADENFIPTDAQPARGQIYYSRSTDGGSTWEIWQQPFLELGPNYYLGFTIGAYAWAEPKNGVLAFAAGDFLTDGILMKSSDNGESWQKTLFWEHPYPMLDMFTTTTDTFYCADGSLSIALDNSQKAHIVFGLSRIVSPPNPWLPWHFPGDGIAYWNENLPAFSNDLNALNPYGGPGSELVEDVNLIGWMQDVNNNGMLEIVGYTFYPSLGLCTMPQICVDQANRVLVLFSAITELYNNGEYNYRHIWFRGSPDGGTTWGDFTDLSNDLIHVFDECVYPVISPYTDGDYFYYSYQADAEPGLTDWQNAPMPNDNRIIAGKCFYIGYGPWITADFYAENPNVMQGDTVHFINLSTGNPLPTEYEWTFEGGDPTTSAETNPSVMYHNPGIFDVKLVAIGGGGFDQMFKANYINVNPVAVETASLIDEPEIFPNPSSGIFTIHLQAAAGQEVGVVLYNMLGTKILEEKLLPADKPLYRIDLTGREEGLYYIRLSYGDETFTGKLIVKK